MKKKIPRNVPVAPLLPWIVERAEAETLETFAQRCGVSSRRFGEILAGRARFMSFNNLDKMLANEGSRSIMDFYPEYYDDEAFFNIETNSRYIDSNSPHGPAEPKRRCSMDGCDMAHHSKGFCNLHYREHRRAMKVAA